jgi:DNA-binding SARP family transcriptional activator
MRSLVRGNRRAEALQAYRDLRERLARELGVEPDAELQRLHVRILRDGPL